MMVSLNLLLQSFLGVGWRFHFISICQSRLAPCCAQIIIHKQFISIKISSVNLSLPSGYAILNAYILHTSYLLNTDCSPFFIFLIFGVQCSNFMLSALFVLREQHSFQSFLKTQNFLLLFNIFRISGIGTMA